MNIREAGEICEALRRERRVESMEVYSKMEDGTATEEERLEFSRWLNHDLGILDAEHAILKAMYREIEG